MRFLPICLIFLQSVLGNVPGIEDLTEKSFVFMKGGDVNLEVHAEPKIGLKSFTSCLWYYSDHPWPYVLFSYEPLDLSKAIVLRKVGPHLYNLKVGSQNMTFGAKHCQEPCFRRTHVCASVESDSGIAMLWENGKPMPRQVANKNYAIGPVRLITLGRSHNPEATDKPYMGEMWEFQMWDWALSQAEVCLIMGGQPAPKPFVDWRALWYKRGNSVAVKPILPSACQISWPWDEPQCAIGAN